MKCIDANVLHVTYLFIITCLLLACWRGNSFFGGILRFIAEKIQRKKKRFPLRLVCCSHFVQLNTSLFSACPDMTTLPLFSPWTVGSSPYLAVFLTRAIIYAVYTFKLLHRLCMDTLLANAGCFGNPVAYNLKIIHLKSTEMKKKGGKKRTMAPYFQMCD